MTGMRSWTAEARAFGLVVRIRAGLHRVAARVIPAIPQSCECEQLPVIDLEAVWLLGFSRLVPLIETVCGNQAPAGFQRIAECGFRGCCFRPRVDHAGCPGG